MGPARCKEQEQLGTAPLWQQVSPLRDTFPPWGGSGDQGLLQHLISGLDFGTKFCNGEKRLLGTTCRAVVTEQDRMGQRMDELGTWWDGAEAAGLLWAQRDYTPCS